jgi:crossover junction endodeoxyribonuclease RusA
VSLQLILPIPPSVNSMYRVFRNRSILSKPGRDWYKVAIPLVKEQTKGWFCAGRCKVTALIYFPDHRRTDLDNRWKGVLDALTKGEVFNDDSQVDYLCITRMEVDKHSPRCEVYVEAI